MLLFLKKDAIFTPIHVTVVIPKTYRYHVVSLLGLQIQPGNPTVIMNVHLSFSSERSQSTSVIDEE